ncbi:Hypothetical predicted protein [Pelobates cultripes]|uniref:Uncharacterized protein n=1 Tax=Pelobates cultripes TaxID=61616 RepID=A0AAD1S429_PELCU|nr:Hypothetical predicted protein [Pelobates cultripes]
MRDPGRLRESTEKPAECHAEQADYTTKLEAIFTAFWQKLERRMQQHADITHGLHPSKRPRGEHKMATAHSTRRSQGQLWRKLASKQHKPARNQSGDHSWHKPTPATKQITTATTPSRGLTWRRGGRRAGPRGAHTHLNGFPEGESLPRSYFPPGTQRPQLTTRSNYLQYPAGLPGLTTCLLRLRTARTPLWQEGLTGTLHTQRLGEKTLTRLIADDILLGSSPRLHTRSHQQAYKVGIG